MADDWAPPEIIPLHYDLGAALEEGMLPPDLVCEVLELTPALLADAVSQWRRTKLERYNPNRGQALLHASKAPLVFMCTGNQYGKSTASAIEPYVHMTGEYPSWWRTAGFRVMRQPVKVRIGIPDFKQHGQEMENRMRALWPSWGDKGVWRTRRNQEGKVAFMEHTPTGSSCEVLTYKQDPMTWEGWAGDLGVLDEPPPRAHFLALWRGLMARGGQLLMTLTPLAQPWMYRWIVKGLLERRAVQEYGWPVDKPLVEIITGSIEENPVNTEERIAALLGGLTPEEEATRRHGHFAFLQGLVYSRQWDPERHVCKPFEVPEHWTRYCAIDPHESKPTAVLYCAVAPWGQRFYYRELEVRDDTPRSLAKACLEAERGERIATRFIDASSDKQLKVRVDHGKDYSRRNWLTAFRDAFEEVFPADANTQLTKVTGSQQAIALVKDRLREDVYNAKGVEVPLLQVFSSCSQLIDQVEMYQHDEHKGGVLAGERKDSALKLYDDYVDCLHYLEAQDPAYFAPRRRRPARSKRGGWMSA